MPPKNATDCNQVCQAMVSVDAPSQQVVLLLGYVWVEAHLLLNHLNLCCSFTTSLQVAAIASISIPRN